MATGRTEPTDYFVIEGYQEGCISITNDEPTDADLNWLSRFVTLWPYSGVFLPYVPYSAEKDALSRSFI